MTTETGSLASRRDALRTDTPRRIEALQRVMREQGIGATLLTATAGPGLFGVAKYFSNLVLWYGRAYVVIGPRHSEPALVHWSGFQSKWNRQEATTQWIETPDVGIALDSLVAFRRALDIAIDLAGDDRRIGVEHAPATWAAGEWEEFRRRCPDYDTVNLALAIDRIRSVKSSFELAEIRWLGDVMTRAMDAFAVTARPGTRIWRAAAAAEEVLKAEGCAWGRTKMALDDHPATLPPLVDRRFHTDDVALVEIDYSGPFGHWYEMTRLYSFHPLPSPVARTVRIYEEVIARMAGACRSSTRIGDLPPLADGLFRERGCVVTGMHLPHCHSIGLDETDGPNSAVLGGERTFLMSDLFQVTPAGGVRQAPRPTLHRILE
jgi:Xaa-Pro aminopeptidase